MNHSARYEYPNEYTEPYEGISIKKAFFTNSQGIHSHWHERLEIIFMQKGSLLLFCNNEAFELKSGNIAFINPNKSHRGQYLESENHLLLISAHLDMFKTNRMDQSDQIFRKLAKWTNQNSTFGSSGSRIESNDDKSKESGQSFRCTANSIESLYFGNSV